MNSMSSIKRYNIIMSALLLSSIFIHGHDTSNQITKIFYHQGMLTDRVVCYFSQDPLCKPLSTPPSGSNEKAQLIFFLPMVKIQTLEAQQMLTKVNGIKRPYYTVQLQEVKKPDPGVKVLISYDPRKILCECASCDSISMQKGLVFSFHNKDLLCKLKIKTDNLLEYASIKHPNSTCTVMLDFGHGGPDDGKVGCQNIKEKDINLQVGNKVAKLLRDKGYHILFTRKHDKFVSLDERTLLANKHNADLFVSIHANSATDSHASGVETFWTSRQLLKKKFSYVDAQSEQKLSSLSMGIDRASNLLAEKIQENVIAGVQQHGPIVNRGVKTSVAQVLLGTDKGTGIMASALIEVGFLSNPEETKKLSNTHYQMVLAQGICNGIDAYCKTLQPDVSNVQKRTY